MNANQAKLPCIGDYFFLGGGANKVTPGGALRRVERIFFRKSEAKSYLQCFIIVFPGIIEN